MKRRDSLPKIFALATLMLFPGGEADARKASRRRRRMRAASRKRRQAANKRIRANQPKLAHSDAHAINKGRQLLEVLSEHNPDLQSDFLIKADPNTVLNMPSGEQVPLWRTEEFHKYNFRISYAYIGGDMADSRTRNTLNTVLYRITKSMAHPAFRRWLASKVGEANAGSHYNRFRRQLKSLKVIVSKKKKGSRISGIAAGGNTIKFFVNRSKHTHLTHTGTRYSTFGHELQHLYGYSHDAMRRLFKLQGYTSQSAGSRSRWDYELVDLSKKITEETTS